MARLKQTYTQSCKYCHQEFTPTKRGTQVFCSASCRTTHCRKKNDGTLGRATRLLGPGRGQSKNTFTENVLASATGALAANAVSQTTEYLTVTKGLVKQVELLTHLVQQLLANHSASAQHLGRGTLNVLTRLGATKEEALQAMKTPFRNALPVSEDLSSSQAVATPLANTEGHPTLSPPLGRTLDPQNPPAQKQAAATSARNRMPPV